MIAKKDCGTIEKETKEEVFWTIKKRTIKSNVKH